jgi:hypothetical protein
MKTDWDLVRAMMQAAIDFCERAETLGVREKDRGLPIETADRTVSVFDIMTSAWVYPETMRYQIVRERHDKGADLPYVPETARVLVNMAEACAELVGGSDAKPAHESIQRMLRWYDHQAVRLDKALVGRAG